MRYNAKLNFFDLFMPAAMQFDEYKNWETDRISIKLRDFEKHCSLLIRHRDFAYAQDSSDVEMEKERLGRTLKILPQALEIEHFIRFGYRRRYLSNLDITFESLIPILYVKLYSQNKTLRTVLSEKIDDLYYRLDFTEDLYQYHVTIGPVRREEIPKHIGYNIENHLEPKIRDKEYQKIIEGYPDVAVFTDIDFFRVGKKLKIEEAGTFVELARQKVHELANNLDNYIFKTEIEDKK